MQSEQTVNDTERATRPSGSALTSDSAETDTRHLDLIITQDTPTAISGSEQIVTIQPIVPVEPIVPVDKMREMMRRTAIEQEIQLMSSSPESVLDGIASEGSVGEGALQANTLDRIRRDARFRLPRRLVRKLLDEFCGDREPVQATPQYSPRTIAIVAHPDDESIGMGAQLSRLQDVVVVHVTDGAPRDPAYALRMGFDHPADYAAARRREAREALRLVGIPEERLIALEIPDGEVQDRMVDVCYAIAELIENLKPDVVVTHPYEGGHTDHDAISFAVQLACGVLRREGLPQPAVLEFTSYHQRDGERVVSDFLKFSPRDDVRTIELPEDLRGVKQRMYDCFETQRECLAQFETGLERFRPAPRYNYTKPPHAGTLDYERLSAGRLSGDYWRRQAFGALQRLRMESGRRAAH